MPDISMGQMFNEAADARQKFYHLEQQSKLRDIFSQHINTKGDLDENKFYQAVQDAGLDDVHAATAMSWAARKKAAQNNTAELNWNMRTLGTDPTAAPRNNAPRGGPSEVPQIVSGTDSSGRAGADPFDPTTPPVETKPVATAPAPATRLEAAAPPAQQPGSATAATGAPAEGKAKWDLNDWWTGLKGNAGQAIDKVTGAPAAPKWNINEWFQQSKTPAQGPAESAVPSAADNGQIDVRAGNTEARGGEEGKLPLPPVSTAQYAVQPDNRSSEQIVEDSFDPSKVMGMPGANGGGSAGKQYFQVDQTTTPDALQTIATGLQRNGLLGNDASPVAINAALQKAQDADYAALGPAPGPQLNKEGKYDRTATMNAFREYQAKYAGVYKDWVGKYGKEYADQLSQKIAADNNDRATVQLNNDVEAKNAGYKGMNDLVTNVSASGNKVGLAGTLDPRTFPSVDKAQAFGDQVAAYSKIPDKMPTNPLEATSIVKNIIQAEGVGPTEGMMSLFSMLGINDPKSRFLISQAQGGKIDASTLTAAATPKVMDALFGGSGVNGNLKPLKENLLIKTQWEQHKQQNGESAKMPTLTGYQQNAPTSPSQAQTAPPAPTPPPAETKAEAKTKALAKLVAKLGTRMNPYPEGKEPPMGAWYMYKGHLIQRKH